MPDAPDDAGRGPERDESGPLWRHAFRQVAADLLAALDRHWIGAVWGASAACCVAGTVLDAPRLAGVGQLPFYVAMTAFGGNMLLDARGSDWCVSWRPPSRWRFGRFRESVAVRVEHTLRLLPGTRLWEEAASTRVERRGPGVYIGPLEIARRPRSPCTARLGTVGEGEAGDA